MVENVASLGTTTALLGNTLRISAVATGRCALVTPLFVLTTVRFIDVEPLDNASVLLFVFADISFSVGIVPCKLPVLGIGLDVEICRFNDTFPLDDEIGICRVNDALPVDDEFGNCRVSDALAFDDEIGICRVIDVDDGKRLTDSALLFNLFISIGGGL